MSSLRHAGHVDDANQCSECGAEYRPVSSSGGGRPAPSYAVCNHRWGCPERKPTWGDYLQRSLP
jgi:hypothetical protein